jgi:hypothetical protein
MVIGYNEPITFGSHGTARNLNCTGIDFSEDRNQSWTNAPMAELDIEVPFARQGVLFQMEATPFIIPDVISAQNVFIFLGGLFIGYCTLRGHGVSTFSINRNIMAGRPGRLSLVIPTATSPMSLRISDDMRELGICLTSIVFSASSK